MKLHEKGTKIYCIILKAYMHYIISAPIPLLKQNMIVN